MLRKKPLTSVMIILILCILPLSFAANTTVTFYSQADKRLIRETAGEAYQTLRSGAGSTNYAALYLSITSRTSAPTFSDLSRLTYIFNTSSIPDTATILAVNFSIYGGGAEVNNIPLSDANGGVTISQGYSASDTALATSDFNLANLYTTRWATDKPLSQINNAGYTDFELNAAGKAGINLTGVTKISMRSPFDFDNTTPESSAIRQDFYIPFKNSATAGTSQDPKLVVVYEEAAAPSNSCTYTTGDWTINMADNCNITTTVTMTAGSTLRLNGTPAASNNRLYITGTLRNYSSVICSGNCTVWGTLG